MLGKDSSKSEYWHFKDDNTRIYIRMEEEIPLHKNATGSAEMGEEAKKEAEVAATVEQDL